MSIETLRVRIEAQDAASATLVRIGRAATDLVAIMERLNGLGTDVEREPPVLGGRAPASADRTIRRGGQAAARSGTIAMGLDDGATAAVSELSRLMGGLDGRAATVRVDAETSGAMADLTSVGERHGELAETAATMLVVAETQDARVGLAEVERQRGRLDGGVAIVRAGAETGGAVAELDAVRRVREELDGSTASVSVEAETLGAQTGLARVREEAAALAATEVAVSVRAETAGAQAALAVTRAQHGAMDGVVATMQVGANTAAATGAMAGARAAHAALNGATATMRVAADTSEARAGIGWAAGYAGRVLATSYIDIVTRRSTVGIGPTARHGGVPGYAHGGVVLAEMHEAGPEALHFPGGDTGMTSGRGVYAVPQGTYVSPAPASRGHGGMTIEVNINGPVYGISDITEQVAKALNPVLVELANDIHGSQVRVQ